MNMIDLLAMTGGTAPAADPTTPADQAAAALKKRMAGGADPVQSLDEVAKKFGANLPQGSTTVAGAPVVGSATLDNRGIPLPAAAASVAAPAGGVGMAPAGGVGVGSRATPASVADLTGPTVRSLAAALSPSQQSPQPPPLRTVGAVDAGAYGTVLPNGQTVYPSGPVGMGNYAVPSGPGAAAAAGSQPGSSMPGFDQYLQQQAGKSGMSALQQASTFAPGSQARAGAQQEYSGLLGAQQKFGLDTNAQRIEQQRIAAGLVGTNLAHEGDAAKELGQASKNAYVQAFNEVKTRGGSDAEAHKSGMDRMQQVASADEAFKGMKRGAAAGATAGGVGVGPAGAAPAVSATAPADKGALVAMETDPLVQGLFQSAGPQGATPTGVINGNKIDADKFLQAYGGVAGKMTPDQKKGVAQALASRLGGAQNASQQLLDALAERQYFGGIPQAGDFKLSTGSVDYPFNTVHLNAPGFKSTHTIGLNRVATPTLGTTKANYAKQAPTLADLLSYTLPLTQQ